MKTGTFVRTAAIAGGIFAVNSYLKFRSHFNFKNRCVFITGGSRGLGLLLAKEILRRGGKPVLLARDIGELEQARDYLENDFRREVLIFQCDVADQDQVKEVVQETIQHYKRIDVLINNAGIMQVGPAEMMTHQDYADAMNIHFWGPLNLMYEVIPRMKRQRHGRIVNISSIGGKIAIPHMAPYCASKFALVGLSDGLRTELSQYGIRITTVCPWLMKTGSHMNISIKGKHCEEFAAFAISAARMFSLEGEQAARNIVNACAEGKRSLTLGLPAKFLALANVLVPSMLSSAMEMTNSFLPKPTSDQSATYSGWDSASRWAPSILTKPADKEIPKNNELRGHSIQELQNPKRENC